MFDRTAGQQRTQTTSEVVFPAPSKGWVQSGNITTAKLDQAEVLDNFFPTAQAARLRGGCTVYADIGTSIVRLMAYASTVDDMFAATASGVYDADRINGGGAVFADLAGLGSGDWSYTQISTGGGQYMVAVNGVDWAHYWNGSGWYPITDANVSDLPYDTLSAAYTINTTVTGGTSGATATVRAITQTSATAGTLRVGPITGTFQNNETLTGSGGSGLVNGTATANTSTITITNIATTALSQVWLFKRRLFFVEKNTLSVWYLPVDSVGGAAVELDLGPVFRKGGVITFGATWSLDSGSGLDDVCIFVTSLGEIAVYEGTDPSSASTWSLVGVYDIAPPLNKHAYFKAGGDLAILTADGIIPVSAALKQDRAALQAAAISYPIEDAWKTAVANTISTSFPISPTLWQQQSMLLIGVPEANATAFVANARTGAWCRFTGWDVRCGVVSNEILFFGTNAGEVMQAEDGGNDNGVQYTGIYVPKFVAKGGRMVANHAGLTFRAGGTPVVKMVGHSDYKVTSVSAPSAMGSTDGDVWGTGVWGTFIWGGDASSENYTVWKAIRAEGYSIAPGVYVTSNQSTAPIFDLYATRVRYEAARNL